MSHTCRRMVIVQRSCSASAPIMTRLTCCKNTALPSPPPPPPMLLALTCSTKMHPIPCCSGTSCCRMLSTNPKFCPSDPACGSAHQVSKCQCSIYPSPFTESGGRQKQQPAQTRAKSKPKIRAGRPDEAARHTELLLQRSPVIFLAAQALLMRKRSSVSA